MTHPVNNENPTTELKGLTLAGGIAPWATLLFYVAELTLIPWDSYPTTTAGWFELIHANKLSGLFIMNGLDIISITLMGLMFLALYFIIKKFNPVSAILSLYFGLLGVAAFVIPRIEMLSLLSLSDKYVAATAELRPQILAAGEALGALGTPTPQTIGFLLMAVAVLIISIATLRNGLFGKLIAVLGILAALFTFLDQISLIALPSLATPLMIASGLFWLPWWALTGWKLIQHARRA